MTRAVVARRQDVSPPRQADRPAPRLQHERNPGMPLNMGWVHDVRVNRSAVERRATTMVARRTVKKEWQAAWLLRAITVTSSPATGALVRS